MAFSHAFICTVRMEQAPYFLDQSVLNGAGPIFSTNQFVLNEAGPVFSTDQSVLNGAGPVFSIDQSVLNEAGPILRVILFTSQNILSYPF